MLPKNPTLPRPSKQSSLQKFFQKKNLVIQDKSVPQGVTKLPLVIWDSISACDGLDCPMVKRCPYMRIQSRRIATSGVDQRCLVQVKYLKLVYQNLIKTLLRKNLKSLDEQVMQNVGLLLMPLFGHLIKFKIIEAGMSFSDIYTRANGVSPIYLNIRNTIKEIREMSKNLIPRESRSAVDNCLGIGVDVPDEQIQQNYHDRLERSAERAYQKGKMELVEE